jgi:UPF0716 protein FxsA
MAPVLFVLLVAVPIAELWVIIEVAGRIGLPATLALLIVVSAVGAWLLKKQGVATWRRLQDSLRRGEMPTRAATDGALILLGGALMLTPGFLSDAVGLLLVLPPSRAAVKSGARRLLGRWAARRFGAPAGVYVRRRPRAPGPDAAGRSPARLRRAPGPVDGDSPDRG